MRDHMQRLTTEKEKALLADFRRWATAEGIPFTLAMSKRQIVDKITDKWNAQLPMFRKMIRAEYEFPTDRPQTGPQRGKSPSSRASRPARTAPR